MSPLCTSVPEEVSYKIGVLLSCRPKRDELRWEVKMLSMAMNLSWIRVLYRAGACSKDLELDDGSTVSQKYDEAECSPSTGNEADMSAYACLLPSYL